MRASRRIRSDFCHAEMVRRPDIAADGDFQQLLVIFPYRRKKVFSERDKFYS
jgi:hypothetical protein